MTIVHRAPRPLVCLAALVCVVGLSLPVSAQAQDVETTSTHFRFVGRGWGHGLGMSQWGSKGLGDRGWSATKILTHFYKGTSLGSRPGPTDGGNADHIRVGLVQNGSQVRVKPDGTVTYHAEGSKVLTASTDETWTATPTSGGKILLSGPDSKTVGPFDGPMAVRFEEHGTKIRVLETNHRYRYGQLDLDVYKPSSSFRLRAILSLDFEKYLYGIGEVPSSWPVAALRAQAIAARTYALEKANRLGQHRSGCACAVYASTIDQAYIGYEKEAGASGERWVKAVDDTAGLVVLYNGSPVQSFYSSSSGGHTEDNEKQWGGSAIGYLRGRCDPGDFASGSNPNNNWSIEMSESELRSKLAKGGVDVGPITKIVYLSPRGVSGRVTQVISQSKGGVRVVGTTGEARLSGDRFRSLLGLKTNLLGPWLYGGIRARWESLMCAPGPSTSSEYSWSYLDGTRWGQAQDFTVGRLFWNAETKDVFWNWGGILAKYDALRSSGLDVGGPKTDEHGVRGGRAVNYERGRIYYTSKHGAHVIYGGILKRYLAAGGPNSFVGLPITDERNAGKGRESVFQHARIYWGSNTGARLLYGAILAKYIDLGGPGGFLGQPTTDETGTPGGRMVVFDKGRIYWSSSTGSHVVYGGILKRYLHEGGSGGALGLPTSDEYAWQGKRRSDFQGGYITWTSSEGTKVVLT